LGPELSQDVVALSSLTTPCALVDLDRVERNAELMAQRARRLGVRLRPHVKTHKCVEAARMQVRGHFGGITVSTLAEAAAFAEAGFDDISYAVPIAPARIREAVALTRRLGQLSLLADHPTTVAELEAAATDAKVTLRVMLKVDCGYHRAGVDPDKPDSVALARRLHEASWLDFAGVLTHAGHSYDCNGRQQIAVVAEQERSVAVGFAQQLRAAGIAVDQVSIGSTPTLSVAQRLDGVTEVRPGNYIFYDAFQAAIGSCSRDDAALSIMATVIGNYASEGRLVIDAGALALSKDRGATHVDPGAGYGLVTDMQGRWLDALRVGSLSQEHGVVQGPPRLIAELEVGSRVRVVANHSCLAAALHQVLVVTRGEQVVDRWRPVRGWDATGSR
jgi:D-serine deaminase-like pyridoxal phosphate-dependent protein